MEGLLDILRGPKGVDEGSWAVMSEFCKDTVQQGHWVLDLVGLMTGSGHFLMGWSSPETLCSIPTVSNPFHSQLQDSVKAFLSAALMASIVSCERLNYLP